MPYACMPWEEGRDFGKVRALLGTEPGLATTGRASEPEHPSTLSDQLISDSRASGEPQLGTGRISSCHIGRDTRRTPSPARAPGVFRSHSTARSPHASARPPPPRKQRSAAPPRPGDTCHRDSVGPKAVAPRPGDDRPELSPSAGDLTRQTVADWRHIEAPIQGDDWQGHPSTTGASIRSHHTHPRSSPLGNQRFHPLNRTLRTLSGGGCPAVATRKGDRKWPNPAASRFGIP